MKLKETIAFCLERKEYLKSIAVLGLMFVNNDKESIERYQIERFNSIWKDAYSNIPFYKKYKADNHLPGAINDLKELSVWPVLTKQQLMQNPEELLRNYPPDTFNITSGSTGIPLRIPVKYGLASPTNMWIGRAANGVLPNFKTFIIWGHHHLHGTGIRRILNTTIRNFKDWICNYKRISAYDTSLSKMKKAFSAYNKFSPEFVIGYSSSILAFVRCNAEAQLSKAPKAVLCTAGPLSDIEKKEIEKFFNAPVCMEYGSMECGVMAYTVNKGSHYKVFWNTHILQGHVDENNKIRNIVTIITQKYFPLIRYDIGDWLEIPANESLANILTINNIVGRPTDIVNLPCGVSFFAMLIEACVEHLEGIISHQLIVKDSDLTIYITGTKHYSDSEKQSILNKLKDVIPALSNVKTQIEQVDELIKVKSGKTPLVVRL